MSQTILAYDRHRVATLSTAEAGEWRQRVGAHLWIDMVNPIPEMLEWLASEFGLSARWLAEVSSGRPAPAIVYPEYVALMLNWLDLSGTADRLTLDREPLYVVLGTDFLVTLRPSASEPLSKLQNSYLENTGRWAYGLDQLLLQITILVTDRYAQKFEPLSEAHDAIAGARAITVQSGVVNMLDEVAINLNMLANVAAADAECLRQIKSTLIDGNVFHELGAEAQRVRRLGQEAATLQSEAVFWRDRYRTAIRFRALILNGVYIPLVLAIVILLEPAGEILPGLRAGALLLLMLIFLVTISW